MVSDLSARCRRRTAAPWNCSGFCRAVSSEPSHAFVVRPWVFPVPYGIAQKMAWVHLYSVLFALGSAWILTALGCFGGDLPARIGKSDGCGSDHSDLSVHLLPWFENDGTMCPLCTCASAAVGDRPHHRRIQPHGYHKTCAADGWISAEWLFVFLHWR